MSKYLDAIEYNTRGIDNISPGIACGCCDECNNTWDHNGEEPPEEQPDDEGGFSRESCDTCGSTLGGNRYAAHGFFSDSGDIYHLDICVDCLYWFANGEEPRDRKER